MLLSIEAHQKTGKSALAYTAPLPIAGFGFDLGTERAIYGTKFDEWFKGLDIQINKYENKNSIGPVGKDITTWELPQPVQLDTNLITGCMEQWHFFIGKFAEAVYGDTIRSIVIDTSTLARRRKADAYLEELQENNKGKPRKQLLQIEWGVANKAIQEISDACKGRNKNLILVHHLTDEYIPMIGTDGTITTGPSGKFILEGWNNTYQTVDMAIRLEKKDKSIECTIKNCGYNLELEGEKLDNITWDRLVNRVMLSLGDRIKLETRNEH